MIIKSEFLNKLKDFGLNTYEAKLWCALLSRGVSTAGELSDIAAVPRSRSYDVLESLERKGFIITKLGKPFKYLAVSPNEVIERVKKNIKEEADRSVEILNNVKATELLTELELLHSQGVESMDPTELTGYIKTRSSIYNHINKMLKNAKSEITIACSADELIKKYKRMEKSFKEAHKNKVSINILISNLEKKHQPKLKDIKKYATIKIAPTTKHRFIMSDNKELLLMLQDETQIHPLYDTGIWINSAFFVESLSNLFSNSWSKLKKL